MNIPKLRFKDNNDNDYPQWKKKKLKEISDVSSGKRIPKGMQFPSIGKTFYITVSDMGENFVSPLNINTISDDIENIIKKYKVFTGDIIISVAGTLGKINLITPLFNNANLTENCDRISNFKKVYNLYIFYFLKSNIIQETIKKSSTLSSQPKLALERIRNFDISIPLLEEQEKIADFLSTVDKKIENLANTITSLENQKKGLLQQIFSQKLRFKDENGNNYPNWEKKKLGDICKFTGGGTPSTSILKYWNGTIPWISSSDLQTNTIHKIKISRYITNEAVSNSSTKIIPKNSILIVSRVGVGKVAISNCVLCTSQDFTNITEINGNTTFYAYLLKYKMEQLTQNTQGTSIKGITTSDIKNIKLIVPIEQTEQTKIADFLSAFDRKLDNQKAQLEHWQQIKKGLLQQMFV